MTSAEDEIAVLALAGGTPAGFMFTGATELNIWLNILDVGSPAVPGRDGLKRNASLHVFSFDFPPGHTREMCEGEQLKSVIWCHGMASFSLLKLLIILVFSSR